MSAAVSLYLLVAWLHLAGFCFVELSRPQSDEPVPVLLRSAALAVVWPLMDVAIVFRFIVRTVRRVVRRRQP